MIIMTPRYWTPEEDAHLRPFIAASLPDATADVIASLVERSPFAVKVRLRSLRRSSVDGFKPWSRAEIERLTLWQDPAMSLTEDNKRMLSREMGRSESAIVNKVQDLRREFRPHAYTPKDATLKKPQKEAAPKPCPAVVARTCLGCGCGFQQPRNGARLFCEGCR